MKALKKGLVIGILTTMVSTGFFLSKPVTEVYASSTSDNTTDEDKLGSTSEFIALGDNIAIPTVEYGKEVVVTLPIINLCSEEIKNVVITPVFGAKTEEWPFEITTTGSSKVIKSIPAFISGDKLYAGRQEVSWTFKAREDVVSGYYALKFNITYERNKVKESTTLTSYVNAIGSPESDAEADADGGKISTPRIIVTGFSTSPEEVFAGDTFTLIVHVKNTSKTTTVSNIMFDLQAAPESTGTGTSATLTAFLPTSGSSTIFQDALAPDQSSDISIEMTAKADLAQKPYVLNVKMDYEDEKNNPYTTTANVSIPIHQESKFDSGTATVSPSTINVGNEANVMFSIYNTGKTTLYNVQVKFQADSIMGGDVFLGKLDPGATGNVDAYIQGAAPTMDDGTVKALISYEDDAGNVTTSEKIINLYVMEEMLEDPGMGNEFPEDGFPMDEATQKEGIPTWIFIAGGVAGAVVVIVAITVVVKKKKAKKVLDDDLAELNDKE